MASAKSYGLTNPKKYREVRRSLGTQVQVAKKLGVSGNTISRRERGDWPITREAALAIKFLAEWINADGFSNHST